MRRNAVRQKLGRDTCQERSVGVLGEEEQSKEVIEITYKGQSFQVFAYFGKSILFLSSHLTGPWILPKMSVQHFTKMDPMQRPMGACPHLLWGVAASLLTPRKASCTPADREIILDLKSRYPISFPLAELTFYHQICSCSIWV